MPTMRGAGQLPEQAPSQQTPPLQGVRSGTGLPPAHEPLPSQAPPVLQGLPLQADPPGSGAVQLRAASLHDSAQFVSPSGPGQGLPTWPLHAPPAHVSAPLQKRPSLHEEPLVRLVNEPVLLVGWQDWQPLAGLIASLG